MTWWRFDRTALDRWSITLLREAQVNRAGAGSGLTGTELGVWTREKTAADACGRAVAEACLRTRRQSRRESSCKRPEFTPLGVALLTCGRVFATTPPSLRHCESQPCESLLSRAGAPRAGPSRAHRLRLRQGQRHRSVAGALPDVATCVEPFVAAQHSPKPSCRALARTLANTKR